MDQSNSKIITVSFAAGAALIGLSIHLLIVAFAGAFGWVARMADSNLVRHVLPVAIGIAIFLVLRLNKSAVVWGEEVIAEIKKVVWPSRKDTTAMTIVVVVMVLISSVIVTSFDFVSGYAVNLLVK